MREGGEIRHLAVTLIDHHRQRAIGGQRPLEHFFHRHRKGSRHLAGAHLFEASSVLVETLQQNPAEQEEAGEGQERQAPAQPASGSNEAHHEAIHSRPRAATDSVGKQRYFKRQSGRLMHVRRVDHLSQRQVTTRRHGCLTNGRLTDV